MQLTDAERKEREEWLAANSQGLPEDYNADVEEMSGEEGPRNRHERRKAAAEARQAAGRAKKSRAKTKKAKERKRRKKRR